MNSQQARAFLTTLDLGSFSEAALELDTSQSSISYAVAQLEKELGVKLLERGRFGATATEAGLRMVEHLRKILQLEEAVHQEASLTAGELAGTLRVSTFSTIEATHVPKIIMALRKHYPKITVKPVKGGLGKFKDVYGMHQELREDVVREGRTDIGFTMGWRDPYPELIYWKLMDDPYVALLPEPLAAGQQLSIQDLKGQHVIVSGPGPGCPFVIQRLLHEYLERSEPDYWVHDFTVLQRMVAEGVGVGIAPGLAYSEVPEGLHRVTFKEAFKRQILIVIHPDNLKVPAVRAFINICKELFPESELPILSLT